MGLGDRVRLIVDHSLFREPTFGEIVGFRRDGMLEVELDGWKGWLVYLHPQDVELAIRLPLWFSREAWLAA
jgi:hypothetical protein